MTENGEQNNGRKMKLTRVLSDPLLRLSSPRYHVTQVHGSRIGVSEGSLTTRPYNPHFIEGDY